MVELSTFVVAVTNFWLVYNPNLCTFRRAVMHEISQPCNFHRDLKNFYLPKEVGGFSSNFETVSHERKILKCEFNLTDNWSRKKL